MSQVLSKLANEVYLDVMTAYHNNNASGLTLYSQKFLELIEDIDTLLASDDNFLLGTWLESAKKLTKEGRQQILEWAVEELLPAESFNLIQLFIKKFGREQGLSIRGMEKGLDILF